MSTGVTKPGQKVIDEGFLQEIFPDAGDWFTPLDTYSISVESGKNPSFDFKIASFVYDVKEAAFQVEISLGYSIELVYDFDDRVGSGAIGFGFAKISDVRVIGSVDESGAHLGSTLSTEVKRGTAEVYLNGVSYLFESTPPAAITHSLQSQGSARVPGYGGRFDDGRGLRAGDELNGLDAISETKNLYRSGDNRDDGGDNGEDQTRGNNNDWRRSESDHDDGPNGANERGVQNGSGGGVDSVDIQGAGQPVDNHSVVTTTGVADRGVEDLDGPEAAGIFQTTTTPNVTTATSNDSVSATDSNDPRNGLYPIILDLNGNGIEITELSKSTVFLDASGDGLQNRTAWAAAGDGVLFYDPDGHNAIVEKRQYVFTEWDPTANSDIDALRSVFDTNGDGKFNSSDDEWSNFKVLVTNDNGELEAKTLSTLGITEIDLSADATSIELPDGSVITGQTTFTQSGIDKTVAEVTLIAESDSHRVEAVVSTDSSGTRTVTQTGYNADGSAAFEFVSVTTTTGDAITNSYDDNSDGVVDRLQTIDTEVNGSNETVETVTNKIGSDAQTAILVNKTVTTTSSDGLVLTIERDSTGGGWFDQVEVRTTLADASMTITITDQSDDGTVIRQITETMSADGLTRTEDIDQDGDGSIDLTIEHVIIVNPDNSRSETTTYKNNDGSIRKSMTETVSADGQTRTILHDLDGDGDADLEEETLITVNVDGSTISTVTLKNGDESVRSATTHTQSDDALTKTVAMDLDGDGDVDRTTNEVTTIQTDGSRETVLATTSNDGSVLSKTKETLGADKVTAESWVDLDLDGTFQADEQVRGVSVDAGTLERTTEVWERAPDGTITAHSTSVSSADGLLRHTQIDADGDGDTDTEFSDVTVMNGNGSTTRTMATRNGDGTLRQKEIIETSADGLTVTTKVDSDGDGSDDDIRVVSQVLNGDGSTTRTISNYAGNGTTLLSAVTILESADRLIVETLRDIDGDGNVDLRSLDVTGIDGARTITDTGYEPDGVTVISETIRTVSADELVRETSLDADSNGTAETVSRSVTTFPATGATLVHSEVKNGDGTIRSQSLTEISDDELIVRVRSDADGNGTYERNSVQTTVLEADGERVTTSEEKDANGNVLARVQSTQSDDGLIITTRVDANGDGIYDIFNRSETTLNDDGGQTTTADVREGPDDNASLRTRSETTTSGDGRSTTTKVDLDGGGNWDRETSQVLNSDGTFISTTTTLLSDGSIAARNTSVTSADGLTTTRTRDFDGDGAKDLEVRSATTLGSDGSLEILEEVEGRDGTPISATKTVISDDGQTVETFSDVDGNVDWQSDPNDSNRWEYSETETFDTSIAGVESTTVELRSRDGSLISSSTAVVDADRQTTTVTRDTDGDGAMDHQRVMTRDTSGVITTTNKYFDDGLIAESSQVVSADGLTTTRGTDRDGDGNFEVNRTESTTLKNDGTIEQHISLADESGGNLGSATHTVQLDGLGSNSVIDIDGDGTVDFDVSDQTSLGADGGHSRTQSVRDEAGALLSEITSTITGNGLSTNINVDLDGDATADRVISVENAPEGGSMTTTTYNGSVGAAQRITEDSVSSDGRTSISEQDFDADGNADFRATETLTVDQEEVTTFEDLDTGVVEASVTAIRSSNGVDTAYSFDYNANGSTDMVRSTEKSFGDGGETITLFTEMLGSKLNYASTRTTDENGSGSFTDVDIDGDGVVDRTTTREMVYNDDGSTTETVESTYADGSTRARFERVVSSDGRTTSESQDFDGDGKWEKVKTIEIGLDGETVTKTTTFDENAKKLSEFVTTVSADGLLTISDRNGREETTVLSSLDDRSYSWDDGFKSTSSHAVDGAGFETWKFTGIVPVDPGNSDPFVAHNKISGTNSNGSTIDTYQIRIDESAKALALKEAALVFDTVFDRDMDSFEREGLVRFIKDGVLDGAGLAQFLMESNEFNTRYGDGISDAAIVSQLYLNSYGRQPDLRTLDDQLQDLTDGTLSPAELAWGIARSAEHVAVGNGHMITNNYDVIMNGSEFERTYDESKARQIAQNLIDVVYDRDATPHELEYLAQQLLDEDKTQEEIVLELVDASGDLFGEGNNTLQGLSGTAFVQAVFENAFGRAATPQEVTAWTGHIFSGRTTEAQLVASVAMSHEHLEAGLDHEAHTALTPNLIEGSISSQDPNLPINDTLNGTSAQDEIYGYHGDDMITDATPDGGADRLVGGEGSDTLDGGDGSDEYIWSRGDGDDFINDTGTSALDSDRLVLTDVSSSDIELAMGMATTALQSSAGSLLIRVLGGTDEIIRIGNQFIGPNSYTGVEEIEFSDGVIWTRDDINERVGFDPEPPVDGENNPLLDFAKGVLVFGGVLAIASVLGPVFVVAAIIGAIIYDALKTPEAYAHLEFDSFSDQFKIGSLTENDGGDLEIAEVLGDHVIDVLNEFRTLMGSKSHNWDQIDYGYIGHREESLRNGDGASYSRSDPEVLLAKIVSIITQFEVIDGDLKILRAVDFENLETAIVGMTNEEAFDHIFGRLRTAAEYQAYLDDKENIDYLMETFSGSTFTADWEETIQSARDLNLDQSYTVVGDMIDNLFVAAEGADHINGAGGNDTIRSLAGDDTLLGGAGNDLLDGGLGADFIDGGEGVDWATFTNAGAGVAVDLFAGNGSGGEATGDTYVGIENLQGSLHDDQLTGNASGNVIEGGEGNDTLMGHGGDDLIYGGSGNDTLFGDNADFSDATGNDQLFGGVGDDVLHGGGGVDTFDGGEGFDEVSYEHSTSGVIASLTDRYAKIHGDIETFSEIEGLIGSDQTDILTGDSGANTIEGGLGNDLLFGAKGADTYRYALGDGNDVINDYDTDTSNIDRLVFSDILSTDVTLTAQGHDVLILLQNYDVITLQAHLGQSGFGSDILNRIEQIEFSDGVVWNSADIEANIVASDTVSADKFGTSSQDNFIHTKGDGSYSIFDSDNNPDTDKLTFTDVSSSEVSLSRSGDNLVIELDNGERVTVVEQLWNVNSHSLNTIEFDDGVVWDDQAIRDQLVSDMKSGGLVIGTQYNESYSHTLGDGSYSVKDYDFHRGTDSLSFADVNSSDVSLSRFENDVHIKLQDAEVVTLVDQLDEDRRNSVETFEFADGTIWDQEDLRDRLVSEMKASGTVVGTENNENYVHALGDGSYTITDYDFHRGNDRLIFVDANYGDMNVSRVGDDAIFEMPNGETVTILGQFNYDRRNSIEEIEFGNGLIWDQAELRNTVADQMKASGEVFGTELNETYQHSLGDGSYSITDYYDGNSDDRLVFADVLSTDVTIERSVADLNDIMITLSNGETITLNDQLISSGHHGVEGVEFLDGVVFDRGDMAGAQISGGNSGDDLIVGSNGDDALYGGDGNDTINGGQGNDAHYGESGDDLIIANVGADTFDGGSGSDTIDFSYATSDVNFDLSLGIATFTNGSTEAMTNFENILAGSGDSEIVGTSEANSLFGGEGDDVLTGLSGNDLFAFATGSGNDQITDFDAVEDSLEINGVEIDLTALAADISIAKQGEDVSITYGDGDSILLLNKTLASLIGNSAPETNPDAVEVVEGNTATFDVRTNDSDLDGDSLTVISVDEMAINGSSPITLDSGLIVELNTNGELILSAADPFGGIPESGSIQQDLTYVVSDSAGAETAGVISVTILATNAGDDILIGGNGNDTLYGGAGNDTIDGRGGNDGQYGEAGNDLLIANGGADIFDGGSGVDTIDFTYTSNDVTLDLTAGTATFSSGGVESMVNFENIIAGSGDNEITGTFQGNEIYGGSGADVIYGGDGDDIIDGEGGNDAQYGEGGNDLLIANGGADIFDGGSGVDTIDFTYTSNDVTLDLTAGTATFSSGGVESMVNFENIITGSGDNEIFGSSQDNVIHGGSGDDVIYGGDGDDVIDGESGDDVQYGEGGNDLLIANGGADIFDGGSGVDTIDFTYASSNVNFDLTSGTATFTSGDTESMVNFENIIAGSGDNEIIGTSDANRLIGGAGDDILTGGDGNDVFEFASSDGNDIITDFEVGLDTLIIAEQTVSGLDINDLPAEFTTGTSADGSLMLSFGVTSSVTLTGVTEEAFFIV